MRDRADVVHDLRGELTRRCEDQRGGSRIVGVDPLDERDSERERLARAGGRFGEHVAAGENVADHVALDRERLGDPAAERALTTARETPRSAKDAVDMYDSLAAQGPRTIREAMADPNR